ncbi:MAG: hypothetical protein ACI4TF_06060 [Oliverpabstia sp.]
MNEHKYSDYLELRNNYWEVSELHYDTIKDFTFDQWFELKKGASLKMAILTLAEEEIDPFGTPCKSFAICVSDDSAVNELGEEKASLLQFCEGYNVTVLREEGAVFYNYQNDRKYYIREQVGPGAADDAASYLFLWWEMIPTPKEEEEKALRRIQAEKNRMLLNGEHICRKYCLNNIEQVKVLENRLQEMKNGLKEKELDLGESEEVQAKRMKICGRIRALEMHQKEMAAARKYLLEKLEEKNKS